MPRHTTPTPYIVTAPELAGFTLSRPQHYNQHTSSTHTFFTDLLINPGSQVKEIHIMPSTTTEALSLVNRTVSVAPLVLLSATDHYARSAKGTKKRVVGVLLGQNDGKNNVRVSNSFAGMAP